MSRRGRAGGGSVLGGEHVRYRVGVDLAAADLGECAGDDADLIPEKTGALDADHDPLTTSAHGAVSDGADGVLAAMAGLGEAREVVGPDQISGGGSHRGKV